MSSRGHVTIIDMIVAAVIIYIAVVTTIIYSAFVGIRRWMDV